MSLKVSPVQQRHSSYGQQRTFRGLEKFAIERRLRRAYQLMDRLVLDNKGKSLSVLELGCGFFGSNLRALSQKYPEASFTGVDLAVEQEPIQNIKLFSADLRAWESKTTYDAVLSLAVIEHLLEPAAHFSMISSNLRKGGLAGLTTPTPEANRVLSAFAALGIFDKSEITDHQLYLTESGLRTLAAQVGLDVLEYEKFSLGFNQWQLLHKH